jgi:MFS family permease
MNDIIKNKYKSNIWKIFVLYALLGFAFFFIPVIFFNYQHYGLNFFQIGLLGSIGMLTILLLEIPTGAFADLYGRKKSINTGLLCYSITVIIYVFSSSFFLFMIGSIIMGIGSAFISGAWEALLFDSLKHIKKEKDYLKLTMRQESVFMVVLLLSTLISPYLFTINVRYPFYIAAFFSVFLFLFSFLLYEEIPKKREYLISKHVSQIKDGFSYISKHNKIIWLLSFGILSFTIQQLFRQLLSAPYAIFKGFNIIEYGFIGVFSLIVHLVIMNISHIIEEKWKEKKTLFIGFFLWIIFMTLMYLSKKYIYVLFGSLFGAILSAKNLTLNSYINKHLKKNIRATVLSIFSMIGSCFGLVSLLIVGKIIDSTNLHFTIFILIVSSALIGSILLIIRYNKFIWKKIVKIHANNKKN